MRAFAVAFEGRAYGEFSAVHDNLEPDKLFMASLGVVCAVSVWHTVEGAPTPARRRRQRRRTPYRARHDFYGSIWPGDVCGRNNVVSFHNKLGSTGRASRRGQVVSDYPLR